MTEEREVSAQLARIPALAQKSRAGCRSERLGGLTNRNYKI